jgi:sugar phosphate permease
LRRVLKNKPMQCVCCVCVRVYLCRRTGLQWADAFTTDGWSYNDR